MNLRHLIVVSTLALSLPAGSAFAEITLLNVSYDPTRELYQEINTAFAKDWQAKGARRS